jgi:hypothetical protein
VSTGLSFSETMIGKWRRTGERFDHSFSFDAHLESPTIPIPFSTVIAELTGTLRAETLASGTPITGTLEISPMRNHRLRYTFTTIADDGHRYRFDGCKSLRGMHQLRAWTTLPGSICTEDGQEVGTAHLRFPLKTFPSFVSGFRLRHRDTSLEDRRWSGQAERLEVWYDTLTDSHTGTGLWLHHEICAPSDGGATRGYGWLALFPPDSLPEIVRFGPEPLGPSAWFAAGNVIAEPGRRSGSVDGATWELTYHDRQSPLFTFPRIVWRHNLFPSAQIVPAPTASFQGTVALGGRVLELNGAPGGVAHIYGHGNAEQWGWLHANLGNGDVLEVVAAVSRRAGLRRLAPLPFVRLRYGGIDWPRFGILAAIAGSADLELPEWNVTVRSAKRRLRVRVIQPTDRTVVIEYADPDGALATCRNCERADAQIVLERRCSGTWVVEREWLLDGTAHAEIGSRP